MCRDWGLSVIILLLFLLTRIFPLMQITFLQVNIAFVDVAFVTELLFLYKVYCRC